MSNVITKLRQQPAWVALIIFAVLCLWVFSGMISGEPGAVENTKQAETKLQRVQVTSMNADKVNREVTIYGRTEPDRTANLSAEVKGQVKELLVKEGHPVKAGQPIVLLDENDLRDRLASAEALLKQTIIELDGAKSLGKKGYQSEATQAQAEANVASAKAQLAALKLAIQNTRILAPFDGVVNQHFVEVGDYLREGDPIATVVDLDPLVIKADVTENSVQYLSDGQAATARLISGELLEGNVRYIASVSNEGTNTFKIEVEVPNADRGLRAGMSTELSIPLAETWAIRITPAVMALDEKGNLGVKTVKDDVVHFVPIDMVKSDNDGVWLTGMGQQANVITLGQGFVRDGDTVEVVKDMQLSANR